MTTFGVIPRRDGPIGRRYGWGRLGQVADGPPGPRERAGNRPHEPAEIEAAPPLPAPCLVVKAAADAAIAALPCAAEQDVRFARQVGLVILARHYGINIAARTFDTLPGAAREALRQLGPVVARNCLPLLPTEASYEAVLAKVHDIAPDWSLSEILTVVAETFQVPGRGICARRRTRDIVLPRHTAMWLGRRFTLASLPMIGRFLGGRDHSTVIHGIRRIDALIVGRCAGVENHPRGWATAIRDAEPGTG